MKASAWLKTKPPAWLVTSPIRYAWLIPLTILPQSTMGLLFPTFGPDTSAGLLPMPQILSYYAIFFFFGAIYFDCDDGCATNQQLLGDVGEDANHDKLQRRRLACM